MNANKEKEDVKNKMLVPFLSFQPASEQESFS
jgi:hypothetical protein